MRLYSTKTLLFRNGEENFKLNNLKIDDAPDWVEKTELFNLAKEDGSLTVISNTEQKIAAENGDLEQPKKGKENTKKDNNDTEEK